MYVSDCVCVFIYLHMCTYITVNSYMYIFNLFLHIYIYNCIYICIQIQFTCGCMCLVYDWIWGVEHALVGFYLGNESKMISYELGTGNCGWRFELKCGVDGVEMPKTHMVMHICM